MLRWLGLALTGLVLLAACGGDDPTRSNEFVGVTALTITSPLATIAPGTSVQLTAAGDFSGVFTRDVTGESAWTTSDAAVLTVVEGSRVRAVAPGTATVTAILGGVSGAFQLTISNATPTRVTVSPATVSRPRGLSQPFTASGAFSDGSIQDITLDAAWTSDAPAVATVNASGLAKGETVGTASIAASFGGQSGSGDFTVTEPALQSVTVEPQSATLIRGATQAFTLTGRFDNGESAPLTEGVEWNSSVPGVATITGGTATAVALGTTVITGKLGALSATANLTVAAPERIDIGGPSGNLTVGGANVSLTATATFSGGRTLDVTALAAWDSSNDDVATVNDTTSKGLVTAEGRGTAEITAVVDGVTGRRSITVVNGG